MSKQTNILPDNPQIEVIKSGKTGLFTNYIYKAIPLAFDESMSYYETLCGLLHYLKNTIIPTVNNNADAVAELQTLYEELRTYVDDYFKGLDVQEEINNKLDEMVADGTLQEIIASYLNSKAIFGFNTVADMKSATNLINGSYAKTMGYHTKNDGGCSTYKIREITNQDIVDESTIISLSNNSLIAELILVNSVSPMQFGCYGDGVHDDTTNIKKMINFAKTNNYKVVFEKNKKFKISDTINVSNLFIDFNESEILTDNNIDMIIIDSNNELTTLYNLNLNANNSSKALYIKIGKKVYINNILITNIKEYGIYYENGYEIKINHANLKGDGVHQCTGIYASSSDSYFNDIVLINCYTGIYNLGYNMYNDIHGWISEPTLLYQSRLFQYEKLTAFLTNIYSDTYHYAFFCKVLNTTAARIYINNFYSNTAIHEHTADSFHNEPLEILHTDSPEHNGRFFIMNGGEINSPTALKMKLFNNNNFAGVINVRFPSAKANYLDGIPVLSKLDVIDSKLTAQRENIKLNIDTAYIDLKLQVTTDASAYSLKLPFIADKIQLPIYLMDDNTNVSLAGIAYINNEFVTLQMNNDFTTTPNQKYLLIQGQINRLMYNI